MGERAQYRKRASWERKRKREGEQRKFCFRLFTEKETKVKLKTGEWRQYSRLLFVPLFSPFPSSTRAPLFYHSNSSTTEFMRSGKQQHVDRRKRESVINDNDRQLYIYIYMCVCARP